MKWCTAYVGEMVDSDLTARVRQSLSEETRDVFERRVDEQADALREAIATGDFENETPTVGFELEAYAVDDEGTLARVPDAVFDSPACNKELGLHNVELNTDPDAFDADGVAAQAAAVRDRVAAARDALDAVGLTLVLDGMWTVPPGEGSVEYLSAVDVDDDVTVARNMRTAPRYVAIDNDILARAGGAVSLDLPGVERSFPTILVESLTSSIQPHLQIPDSASFPTYYDVGIRTLGPVLALTSNSPFLPADFYPPDLDPYDLVERTYHELRVPVFEQSINAGESVGKVRFPRDIETPTDPVDRLVADRTCAPFLKEWVVDGDAAEAYHDRIWELDHKRGTYWRWLRTVAGGTPLAGVGEESLRIEYRPIPTQPTVPDVVGVHCLVSGLLWGLVEADHPLSDLPWGDARDCFYDVVREGLDADLAWVDADGERTDDPDVVFGEVFEYARRGLRSRGLDAVEVDDYLAPVERRWTERTTPSRWKKRTVRTRLDAGDDLRTAVEGMQREYVDRCRDDDPLVEWPVR
jgi:hypothetical protein